jgi:hypothetical protein
VTGVALGVAFFLLGSTYLSLSGPQEISAVLVVGGKRVRAGSPAHLRVVARSIPGRRALPVSVRGLELEGKTLPLSQEGDSPVMIVFEVPVDAPPRSQIVLRLTVGGEPRTLPLEVEVSRFTPTPSNPDLVTPVALPEIATPHRVEVRPEQGELVLGMENRLFVRVRAMGGEPIPLAPVHLVHKSLPGGEVHLITDSDGLAEALVIADQPSLRIKVEASAGGETTRTDALLRPRGRLLILETEKPVFRPGEAIDVRLRSWKPVAPVVCDLLWEGAWIWSRPVTTAEGLATIALGTLEPSRYDLQCSPHAIDPGEAWASVPIWVDERPPLSVLAGAIEAGGHIHPSGAKFSTEPVGRRTLAYLASHLRSTVERPHVLVSTRESDLRAQKETRARAQFWLLLAMAAVVLIVLLFVADLLISHSLDTRDRMRAFAMDSLEDGTFDPDHDHLNLRELGQRQSMLKTRGMLLVFILLGTITLNAAGILAVLQLSAR